MNYRIGGALARRVAVSIGHGISARRLAKLRRPPGAPFVAHHRHDALLRESLIGEEDIVLKRPATALHLTLPVGLPAEPGP